MSDLTVRLLLVVAVVAVAGIVVAFLRTSTTPPERHFDQRVLGPGVYLLASDTCATCAATRDALSDALGADGFTELAWESDPEVFSTLGIQEVPATLVVTSDRASFLHPGPGVPGRDQLSP